MTAKANLELGFRRVADATTGRTVARFCCSECRDTTEVTITTGIPINPEGLANKAKERGWIAYSHPRGRSTYCPKCAAQKNKKPNDVDSELKKVIKMAAVSTVTPAVSMTPDQKQRVRTYLDKHFDDGVGCYLDDMTDDRIAELVNVPRVAVTMLREAAYGPIRVDPEVTGLRKDLAALTAALAAARENLTKLQTQVDAFALRLNKTGAVKAA